MILTYHEVVKENAEYLYSVTSLQLDAILGLVRVIDAQRTHKLRQPEVTFDDGHISNYELALPLLQKHRIAARFFVTSNWIGKRPGFMDWSHLRELLSLGHQVGSHGASHQLLTHCSAAELLKEVQGSKQSIEDALGIAVHSISVPGGRWNQIVVDTCKRVGYEHIYISDPTFHRSLTNGIEISGRLMVQRGMTARTLEPYLMEKTGALLALRGKNVGKSICRRLLGDVIYARVWRALAAKNQASYE
jgi:peptidoglycan/xylan/chitin deacetylase (PgdA/CDA1 family)